MTEPEYQELCRQVSLNLGKDDVNALGETGRLEIEGVEFAIHFVADQAPDTLFCYVKLGAVPVPVHERATACESLLRLNMLTGTKTVGVFALETEGDHAVFVAHIATGGRPIDPKALAGRLRLYAKQALDVRATVLAGSLSASPAPQHALGTQLA